MDPDVLLQQLAPLREPAPIGWWPPAPGWWLLAAVILVGVGLLALALYRRRQAGRYRRQALARLKQLSSAGEITLEQLNQLLKATAMRGFSATDVARLHGANWQQFLIATAPKLPTDIWQELAQVYRHPNLPASPELLQQGRQWLRRHRSQND